MSVILTVKLRVKLSSEDELKRAVKEFADALKVAGIDNVEVEESYSGIYITGDKVGTIGFRLDGGEVVVFGDDYYRGEVSWVSKKFSEFLMQREALKSILSEHPFATVSYEYDEDEDLLVATVDW